MTTRYILPIDKTLTLQEASEMVAKELRRWADILERDDRNHPRVMEHIIESGSAKMLMYDAIVRHTHALERWLARVQIIPD